MIRRIRSADLWSLFIPVSLFAYFAARWAAGAFALFFGSTADTSQVLSAFRAELEPKLFAQAAYVFFLIFWPIALIAAGWIYRKRKTRPFYGEINVFLAIFFAVNVVFQEVAVHHYFGGRSPDLILGMISFLLAGGFCWKLARDRAFFTRAESAVGRWSGVIAATVGALFLSASLFSDRNYFLSPPGVSSHLPFTYGEFSGVALGKTLSVDLFSQYQQLLPYLFSPLFHLFGYDISVYTSGLAVLSAGVLFFVYRILREICRSQIVALVLFLSWIGVSFFPIETFGDARYSTFTYFPVGPLRLFGFFGVAYLVLRLSRRPISFLGQCLGLFVASLALANNFDFGIPALGGALVVFLLLEEKPKRTLGALALGLLGAALVYLGISWIRAGALPEIGNALDYLRAAGKYGYTSLATPRMGDHWIFLAGLLAVLGIGLVHPQDSRTRRAAFLFFGIAGCGAFAYYMNRSHWHVLAVSAPILFFPIMLLAQPFLDGEVGRIGWAQSRVAGVLLLVCVASGLALLKNAPNPVSQWNRIRGGDDSFRMKMEREVGLIQAYASAGESVVVCSPFGDRIAAAAGVHNVFPYPLGGSLLLRSQLERVEKGILDHGVRHLFGDFPMELSLWASENGFREMKKDGSFSVLSREKAD